MKSKKNNYNNMLYKYLLEEDGYYEDLYPQPIGGNNSDDLLDVIVDDSTDAESTEVILQLTVLHTSYIFSRKVKLVCFFFSKME